MARISDSKRQTIAADIRAGKARNQIARDHGVSAGTVTNIAREFVIEDAFDRSATKRATEAAEADDRAWRVSTSRRFLTVANDLLDQLKQPHIVFNIGGKDNVYTEHQLDAPPTADIRNLVVSAATAFDKHLAQDRHDVGGDVSEVESLLDSLFDELQARHGDGSEAE